MFCVLTEVLINTCFTVFYQWSIKTFLCWSNCMEFSYFFILPTIYFYTSWHDFVSVCFCVINNVFYCREKYTTKLLSQVFLVRFFLNLKGVIRLVVFNWRANSRRQALSFYFNRLIITVKYKHHLSNLTSMLRFFME